MPGVFKGFRMKGLAPGPTVRQVAEPEHRSFPALLTSKALDDLSEPAFPHCRQDCESLFSGVSLELCEIKRKDAKHLALNKWSL